jgi:hypothetical protein
MATPWVVVDTDAGGPAEAEAVLDRGRDGGAAHVWSTAADCACTTGACAARCAVLGAAAAWGVAATACGD